MSSLAFNRHGVWAIYRFEIARALRTIVQSVLTPVITTSLYFVVFGAAIGARMTHVNGVAYASFIVPGLIMLARCSPRAFPMPPSGSISRSLQARFTSCLSAPVSLPLEIVIAYVGAASTKSVVIGLTILAHRLAIRAAARSCIRCGCSVSCS
jgi:ABC-2 type transport system permease protein